MGVCRQIAEKDGCILSPQFSAASPAPGTLRNESGRGCEEVKGGYPFYRIGECRLGREENGDMGYAILHRRVPEAGDAARKEKCYPIFWLGKYLIFRRKNVFSSFPI